MPVEAFGPSSSILSAINGGFTAVHSVLVNQSGLEQSQAAKEIKKTFESRIDAALAKLGRSNSTVMSDALLRDQLQLIGRKQRISEAIGVLNKSLNQFNYVKNHIEHLRNQLIYLENGDLTAAEVSVEWDDKLRKLNQLVYDASQMIKDGNSYYQKNLINHSSRTNFQTQTMFAPYNSDGDTLQINGVFLGTDYYITEDGNGNFWNSDTAYLPFKSSIGTLTQYSAYPDTILQSDSVTNVTVNSYTPSTGAIEFTLDGAKQRMSETEPNDSLATAHNLRRQGFKVTSGNTDLGNQALPWTSVSGQINTNTDEDWYSIELQAGEFLTLDVDYGHTMGDSVNPRLDVYNADGTPFIAPAGAAFTNHANTGYTTGQAVFNDDSPVAIGGGGSDGGGGAQVHDSYIGQEFPVAGVYYVKVKSYNNADSGTYTLNVSITPTASSTGLGSDNVTGVVTSGGLGLMDAWIYDNFENQTSINHAFDALDSAESLVSLTRADFLNDHATLETRSSIFDSQIGGISKEVAALIDDVQDEARAELLASQLEYVLANFEFSLMAATGNNIVQSVMLSLSSEDFGVTTNTGRVLITVGQTVDISA